MWYFMSNLWMNVDIWSTIITFYTATFALHKKWKKEKALLLMFEIPILKFTPHRGTQYEMKLNFELPQSYFVNIHRWFDTILRNSISGTFLTSSRGWIKLCSRLLSLWMMMSSMDPLGLLASHEALQIYATWLDSQETGHFHRVSNFDARIFPEDCYFTPQTGGSCVLL